MTSDTSLMIRPNFLFVYGRVCCFPSILTIPSFTSLFNLKRGELHQNIGFGNSFNFSLIHYGWIMNIKTWSSLHKLMNEEPISDIKATVPRLIWNTKCCLTLHDSWLSVVMCATDLGSIMFACTHAI